jgi:cation:H+ antiporter
LLLLIGFVLLYFGAEWLVDGASDIASHFRLSKTFVGLTLVAFGTSAPEMVVNIIAAVQTRATAFALSNIAGSNLTNLCIGFGLATLFAVLPCRRKNFRIDLAYVVLSPAIVVASFAVTISLGKPSLTLPAAGILVGMLIVYLYLLIGRSAADEADDPTQVEVWKPLLMFAAGVAFLYGGGQLVFLNALALAETLKVPAPLIGLTIVAAGTSIPDVTASVVAARRGEHEIAIGNLLGSNISNVLVVLTATTFVVRAPLTCTLMEVWDYVAVVGVSLVFAAVAAWREKIGRVLGIALLFAFFTYFAVRIAMEVLKSGV